MRKNRICIGFFIIAILGVLNASWADSYTFTPEDVAELRVNADNGDSEAQFQLGEAYQKGEGVRQDDTLAAEWYQRSANQGNADGQFALGFAYRGGFGVLKDEILSYMWFDLAASQGNEQAADLRNAVAELMTYDQISEARKKTHLWKAVTPEKATSAP